MFKDFHPDDLKGMGIPYSSFGGILADLEEPPVGYDPKARDSYLDGKNPNLKKYLMGIGVISQDGRRVNFGRLEDTTIAWVAGRPNRRAV